MDVSGIKLNTVRLTKPALELIRSMAGREIRATVVQSSGAGLLLRSGGTQIEARASGLKQPLTEGPRLFLKVEQEAAGRFRLIVLDPPGASGALVRGAQASLMQQLPPGPLQQIFGSFLRAFTAGGRSPGSATKTAAVSNTDPASATGDARAAVDRMQGELRALAARIPVLDQSALATILQQLGGQSQGIPNEAPDFWLAQGWAAEDQERGDGESNAQAEDYVQSLGRLAEPPHYFLSEFQIGRAGRIHVLLLSSESTFRRLSLFLHAESAATATALADLLPQELPRLIGDDVAFERSEVLPAGPPPGAEGGGLLDLQG